MPRKSAAAAMPPGLDPPQEEDDHTTGSYRIPAEANRQRRHHGHDGSGDQQAGM
jgi:hypothetical protein